MTMSDVPPDPIAFVEEYLPARARALGEALGGLSSVGSVVFRVVDVGEWSLRLVDGELEVLRGVEDDVLMQVTVTEDDFVVLVVDSIRKLTESGRRGPAGALGVLSLDPRTARGLRHMPGSVLLSVDDAGTPRRVLLTPGVGRADMSAPDCTIGCTMADYVAMQTRREDPMQLFANGRLRLTGNVQLALALAGLFG
jgi:hypothetical protein